MEAPVEPGKHELSVHTKKSEVRTEFTVPPDSQVGFKVSGSAKWSWIEAEDMRITEPLHGARGLQIDDYSAAGNTPGRMAFGSLVLSVVALGFVVFVIAALVRRGPAALPILLVCLAFPLFIVDIVARGQTSARCSRQSLARAEALTLDLHAAPNRPRHKPWRYVVAQLVVLALGVAIVAVQRVFAPDESILGTVTTVISVAVFIGIEWIWVRMSRRSD